MRRLLVLAALLILQVAAPAEAVTWGPVETGLLPKYTVPIHVVDTMIDTLRPDHRREWRQARGRALTEWGVPFYVTRMPEASLPYLFDDNIGTVGVEGMLAPDTILIVRNHTSSPTQQGGYSPTAMGGIVILSPWAPWWKPWGGMAGTIAHEYGHALGFNHGGTGAMAGADHVNDEERALALAYYGES